MHVKENGMLKKTTRVRGVGYRLVPIMANTGSQYFHPLLWRFPLFSIGYLSHFFFFFFISLYVQWNFHAIFLAPPQASQAGSKLAAGNIGYL